MYVRSILSRGTAPVLAAGLVLAGCGGSSGADTGTRRIAGPGFTFQAPGAVVVSRTPNSVTVRPDRDSGELASITRFPLVKPFKPALWPKAVVELDGVASRLAMGLVAQQTKPAATVRIGGLRGRRYVMTFADKSTDITQRLTLLLDRRTEYQLLCRWTSSESEPKTCTLLESTFALARR